MASLTGLATAGQFASDLSVDETDTSSCSLSCSRHSRLCKRMREDEVDVSGPLPAGNYRQYLLF